MFEVLILGGEIIDGSGRRRFRGDVAIKKDRIVAVGNLKGARARKIIRAEGRIVTPGFIDILNHSDGYLTFLANPRMESLVRQGVTTVIGGNCGSSLAPLTSGGVDRALRRWSTFFRNAIVPPSTWAEMFKSVRRWGRIEGVNVDWLTVKEFLKTVAAKGLAVNFGTLVGHLTLRRGLLGDSARELSTKENEFLAKVLEEAIDDGALGLSFGFGYSHARGITPAEVTALLAKISRGKKIVSVHLANERGQMTRELKKVINFIEGQSVNLELSHFKIMGRANWPLFSRLLDELDLLNQKKIKVNFDCYPYTTSWSVLYPYLPDWISAGGREKMLKRLTDLNSRRRIIAEIESGPDLSKLVIAFNEQSTAVVGKSIGEIAQDRKESVAETVVGILVSGRGHVICFDEGASPENLRAALRHPLGIVASGGAAYNLDYRETGQLVHPRCFGAFPRFLGRYVREKKILSWEEGIQKITAMPAEKLGLIDRGFIARDMKADMVIFDPEEIVDQATFANPFQFPRGISQVLVNGQVVVNEGRQSDQLSGEVIK